MTHLSQMPTAQAGAPTGRRLGPADRQRKESGAGAASPREVLVIVCAGVVLASLDLFIVNVALPDIARDFGGAGLGELSWVLNGYAIVYAALLVLFGRLADRHRRDLGFLLGVAVFTVASAACAAATSVAMLVAFRLVQAAGAALLTPTSLSLVLATYPPERRHGAVRSWTATAGLAAALGPVVGGLLITASWRWVFLVNVPIGVVAFVVGWRRLPHVAGHRVPRPDAVGAVLVTAGVGLLTFGLVQGSAWGWGSAGIVSALAGSVGLLGLFVVHCLRHHNPLIEPSLFKVRSFSGASVVSLLFSAAFGAMLLSVVLWLQDDWGWSALKAGLAMAPGPLMVPLFSFVVAGRLIPRLGNGSGHRARDGRVRGRRGVVGDGRRAACRLSDRIPARHAADRRRRRPDDADVPGRGRIVAAPAVVRVRVGDDQHGPPGRAGHRGGGPDRGRSARPRRRSVGSTRSGTAGG